MAKVKTRVGILRDVIKEVIGKERYSDLLIFVDKQKGGHRFKIVGGPNRILKGEERRIAEDMLEKHGIEVAVTHGCSGSRMLPWTAFFVPFE